MPGDTSLIDDNRHLLHEIEAAGHIGCNIARLSTIHRHRTGATMDDADRLVEAFLDEALRRNRIVIVGLTSGVLRQAQFALPQNVATTGRAVDTAGFLWDAIDAGGAGGQSEIALLELLRRELPDMDPNEAADYLNLWIASAIDAGMIRRRWQPTNSAVKWYVTPDRFVPRRTVLVQVAQPVGLIQLAEILTAAWREAVRRGVPEHLTSACMEVTDEFVRVYDRPE